MKCIRKAPGNMYVIYMLLCMLYIVYVGCKFFLLLKIYRISQFNKIKSRKEITQNTFLLKEDKYNS